MTELETKLKKYNQEQIIKKIEEMDNTEQEQIIRQINEIDLEEVEKLYNLTKKEQRVKSGKIEPINYIDLEKISKE